MAAVPTQPDREIVMGDLIDALRRFTVESDVFVDVFARSHGLGRSDLNAIMWIARGTSSGEPITVGELAHQLRLSPAAATALVGRLEAVGHVSRTRDPHDRRRVTVTMSETALTVATAFFVPLGERMRSAAAEYSEEELARTAEIVRHLTGAVTAASRAPSPSPLAE
ncbi:MarR family winged helix-turn-helix transcriptional regulator [Actinoplanes sp. NPDC051513]|uniref:MarR family winged helix-turn-helix transcriptional regulator n=1 Tax=Actinoplanes sp. NPDC051513 TaxID=3363908 RepID=UPI0037A3076C